jgi:hypothetical protein
MLPQDGGHRFLLHPDGIVDNLRVVRNGLSSAWMLFFVFV